MAAAEAGAPADRVRDAASVILVRQDGPEPRVLMGQRGSAAAFMPSKFVFPGGAVDAEDRLVAAHRPIPEPLAARLAVAAPEGLGPALAMAAIRELWEETGLALSPPPHREPRPAPGPDAALGPDWARFFAAGHEPQTDALDFVFRAITPPGRPRRFDARFFLVDADGIWRATARAPDDFAAASGELSHLSWLTLAEARALDLPFITAVVLAEVEARLAEPGAPRGTPFFQHRGGRSFIDVI